MKKRNQVEAWTKKKFKRGRGRRANLAAQAKHWKNEIIASVHDGSPAAYLGLKPGWILMRINEKQYDRTDLEKRQLNRRKFGKNLYEFYDPEARRRYRLKSKHWPFGFTLIKPPSKVADNIAAGQQFSWTDVQSFWRLNLISEMSELYPALEAFCAKRANRATPQSLPPPNEPFPPGVYVDATAALSMAAFAAGHTERARFMYRMTEARLQQGGGVSNFSVAMHYHVGSLLSEKDESHEDAVKFARRAFKRSPDVLSIQKRLEALTGETHAPISSEYEKNTALNYELPNTDPVQELASTGQIVSFQKTLDSLKADQLLLVFVMGHYRSNTYYTDDLFAAMPIFKAFPNKVQAIHVICEGDYTKYPEDRQDAEKLAIDFFKMPLQILFDKDRTVSRLIKATGYPSRFFFNKAGKVLSEKQLWDETAIWEAFRES